MYWRAPAERLQPVLDGLVGRLALADEPGRHRAKAAGAGLPGRRLVEKHLDFFAGQPAEILQLRNQALFVVRVA